MTSKNKKEKFNGRKLRHPTMRDCKTSQRTKHEKRSAFYDQSVRQRLNEEAEIEKEDAMRIELTKAEVIALIKSVPIPYGKIKPVLAAMGEFKMDMNGPTGFVWHDDVFTKPDAGMLYVLYQDLKSGKLFKKDDDSVRTCPNKAVALPEAKRTFPNLKQKTY